MFTGIIEETGKVIDFKNSLHGAVLKISCKKVLEGTKIGDSISINGVCQTVIELGENSFSADVSEETLKVTNFKYLKTGETVNLERALKLSDRLNGHIVTGHVEAVAKILKIEKLGNFYNIKVEIPTELKKYFVKKGSVAVNGISLTIAEITDNSFVCAVIPHTYENTDLKELKNSDNVNIETDITAKYIENFVKNNDKKPMTEAFLKENGFM